VSWGGDPGANNQTIGNIIVSLPDGSPVLVFSELDSAGATVTATLKAMHSVDHGAIWSVPALIAAERPVGTQDPLTGQPVRDGGDTPSVAVGPDGAVHVVWQDSGFSGGQHDGIAFASSTDGGASWSAPVEVNGAPSAPAFIPTVKVRADGVIGVAYYDFRYDQRQAGPLTTDYWLATSSDGVTWHDTHVRGPFSLLGTPVAEGLFLGDYQALATSGTQFLPVFLTATGDTANPTDVFMAFGTAAAIATARREPLLLGVGSIPRLARLVSPAGSMRNSRFRTAH